MQQPEVIFIKKKSQTYNLRKAFLGDQCLLLSSRFKVCTSFYWSNVNAESDSHQVDIIERKYLPNFALASKYAAIFFLPL